MVVIGVRHQEETANTFLLIQNFWKEKEFLEIDLDYMWSSKGRLYAIEGEIDDCTTTALTYSACMERAGKIRTCICSSPIDRPPQP